MMVMEEVEEAEEDEDWDDEEEVGEFELRGEEDFSDNLTYAQHILSVSYTHLTLPTIYSV